MMTSASSRRPFYHNYIAKWQFALLVVLLLLYSAVGFPKRQERSDETTTLNTNTLLHRATTSSSSSSRRHRRNMVGAYFPAELTDPFVLEAARYCMTELKKQSPSKYEFLSSIQNTDYGYELVSAQQQVVAGRNYKLVIELFTTSKKECLGAFHVLIYDHFGELSVTHWGEELTCKQVQELKEELKKKAKEDEG